MQDICLHVNYHFQPNVQQILPPHEDRIIGPSLEFQVPSCHSPGPATHKIPTSAHSHLACIVEVAHLIAIIGNQMEQVEGLIAGIHPNIGLTFQQLPLEAVNVSPKTVPSGLPSQARLIAHDVATGQPTQVAKPVRSAISNHSIR